jgi:hypothetical protein
MDSPVAGSKKCNRLVSMASCSGAPDRTRPPTERRPAVHSDRPRLAASKRLPLADDLGQGTLVKVYQRAPRPAVVRPTMALRRSRTVHI